MKRFVLLVLCLLSVASPAQSPFWESGASGGGGAPDTDDLPQINVTSHGAIAGDGTSDSAAIQAAVDAACAAGGGTVVIPDGVFDLSLRIAVTCSGVRVQGNGSHRTVLQMQGGYTAPTAHAIEFYNSTVGTSRPLTRAAGIGDMSVSVSTSDAASFAAGDYVLLRSLRSVERGSTLAGTVTFTANSTAVTGSGTSFTTALQAGSSIRPFGTADWYTIASVTNNTAAVLRTTFQGGSLIGGLATFTNGSTVLTGDGTTFTSLATSNLIRPAGTNTWSTIQTITDDARIVLSANYAGGTTIKNAYAEYGVYSGSAESGSTTKHIGEIHKVLAVDTATGTVDLEGSIGDTYNTYDSSSLMKLTVLENVGLYDLQIKHLAASAPSINTPTVIFRNCRNAIAQRLYIHDAFYTGIDMWSSLDSSVLDNRIEDVRPASSNTVYYGVWVSSAARNLIISGNKFARLRHSVTTGSHGGSANVLSSDGVEGVQRNILIQGNTSYQSTTGHYDTHQPAEGVTFMNNHAYGTYAQGAPLSADWAEQVYCIQARADKTIISGNVCTYMSGGILIFDTESRDAVVSGNVIRDIIAPHYTSQLTTATSGGEATLNVRNANGFAASGSAVIGTTTVTYTGRTATTLTGASGTPAATLGAPVNQYNPGGHGIIMDSAARGPGILISNNEIVNVHGSCIAGNGNQFKVSARGNVCRRSALRSTNAPINFSSAVRGIEVRDNRIEENPKNVAPVQITGGDDHIITGNEFNSLTRLNPSWVGTRTQVYGNHGWVQGNVSNPWPASGSDLIANVSGGVANPVSDNTANGTTRYTVRSGPALVGVWGGTVTTIYINGNNTAETSGHFRLAPGDTIGVQCSVAPTTRIVWE